MLFLHEGDGALGVLQFDPSVGQHSPTTPAILRWRLLGGTRLLQRHADCAGSLIVSQSLPVATWGWSLGVPNMAEGVGQSCSAGEGSKQPVSGHKCVFCRIVAKQEPAAIVYEDEDYLCFRDKSPAATHHYLLVPKTHIRCAIIAN